VIGEGVEVRGVVVAAVEPLRLKASWVVIPAGASDWTATV